MRLVGTFIRNRRELLGMTMKNLGLHFDPPVSVAFISNVEKGQSPLPFAHIDKLAQALGVKTYEITELIKKEFSLKLDEYLSNKGWKG